MHAFQQGFKALMIFDEHVMQWPCGKSLLSNQIKVPSMPNNAYFFKTWQARIFGRPEIKIKIGNFAVPLIYNLAATDTGRFSGTVADVLGWSNGEKTKIFSEWVGSVV